MLENYTQPYAVLAAFVKRVLDSEFRLQELVREADVEWGRIFGERPYFKREGSTPNPEDPYTLESVRRTLEGLIETLAADPTRRSTFKIRNVPTFFMWCGCPT